MPLPLLCPCNLPTHLSLLRSQGARVEINFGRQPFQYDPSALEEAERAAQAEALQG